jgi:hypothetical protein
MTFLNFHMFRGRHSCSLAYPTNIGDLLRLSRLVGFLVSKAYRTRPLGRGPSVIAETYNLYAIGESNRVK